jgi:hypothetical protein
LCLQIISKPYKALKRENLKLAVFTPFNTLANYKFTLSGALGLRIMYSRLQILISGVIILFYVISSAKLSKEILKWEPSLVKRISLVLIVWLIPIVGGVVAYKHLGLDWFKKRSNKSNGAQNVISGAFLELDVMFNPGARYIIEARQKEHVELSEDGQLHNNALKNFSHLRKNQTSESSKKT